MGMTLAHARALLPTKRSNPISNSQRRRGGERNKHELIEPHVEPYNAEYDAAALLALAEWATRFAPIVAPDPPHKTPVDTTRLARKPTSSLHASSPSSLLQYPGLLMDISGCDRLYRNEHQLMDQFGNALHRMGFTCRIATAPTFGCAWAVARFGMGERTAVPEHGMSEALAPLPIRSLRIEADIEAALAEVAIDRVGHVFDLPREALPCRFGDDVLFRLDQALGHAIETIMPVRPAPPLTVAFALNGPTTRYEAIELLTEQLLEQLIDHMQQREVGVTQLDIAITRIEANGMHTGLVPLSISTSHPSRRFKHIWALLRPRLERAHLGHGVEHVAMTATRFARLPHQQSECWQPSDAAALAELDRHLGQLLDTLQHELGNKHITRLQTVETHLPEHAFEQASFPRSETQLHQHEGNTVNITDHPLPSILFSCPEPIEVIALTPDGPPRMIRWQGQQQDILSSIGPLRIAEPWWNSTRKATTPLAHGDGHPRALEQCHNISSHLASRDYFKVQTKHGHWLWVMRELELERNNWFVCGRWG